MNKKGISNLEFISYVKTAVVIVLLYIIYKALKGKGVLP